MKTNLVRLEKLIEEMALDVTGACCEESALVGEIFGKVVKLTVMSKAEAIDSHDYAGTLKKYRCFED